MAQDNSQKNLDRALDLIVHLSKQDEPETIANLSRILNTTRNTAYAMLTSLQSRNFVERTQDGRYLLGYGFMEIVKGYYHQYPFVFIAEKHLVELSGAIGSPVALYVYKSPLNCLRLATTEGYLGLSPALAGGLVHACTTAHGRLLMAAQPEEVILADLAERAVEKYTEYTVTDKGELMDIVREHRDAKYAVEKRQRYVSLATAAVPIRNRADKVVAAIGVIMDADIAESALNRMLSEMELAGYKISEELGNHSNLLL